MRVFIKKSCFVASNEHAAEVIGRNGWKIKSIAINSGAVIKCPTPTEAPIFYISGYKRNVERAKKMIKMWADNFDRMRDRKRTIKCEPGDILETVMLKRADISSVIGRHGKQVKKIAAYSNVTIISPDINKEPIFILSGKKSALDLAIFWIKLTALSATGANYFESRQIPLFARLFQEFGSSEEGGSDIERSLRRRTSFIINFRKLNLLSLNQVFISMNLTLKVKTISEPYRCNRCLSTKLRVAKGLCGHTICCDLCIVQLFRDIYLRCRICLKKIDNFLIVP